MPNILISTNENILKVTYNSKKTGLVATSEKLSPQVVNDSTIVDVESFAKTLKEILDQHKISLSNNPLIFLVEPQDIVFKFVTINKRDGDVIEQIITYIKSKDKSIDFNELYFSHQKVAPFVHQFQAIKKEALDKYLQISNTLQAELKGVIPWPACLPKYISTSEPCIFITHEETKQVVVLSELSGIYYSEVFPKDRSTLELEKLVHDLSIYKRSTPMNKIYTLDSAEFSLDPAYELITIKFEGIDAEEFKGFEPHLLVESVLQTETHLLESDTNLLNILPLPVVSKKSNSLVYVGGGVTLVLLLVGIFGYMYMSNAKPNGANQVLSNQAVNEQPTTTPSPTPVPSIVQLNKSELKIRVENGAGVPGVAANTQKVLQDLGYLVPEIGNATESGRSNSLLKFKTSKISYKDLVLADLKDKYELVVEDGLPESSSYDVLFIVGTK